MTKNTALYLSFWDICLNNLPEGDLTHRHLSPAEAKDYIDKAFLNNTLIAVSDDDLFAPYQQKKKEKHDELRSALKTQFNIELSFEDFASTYTDEDSLSSIVPLQCASIEENRPLLVVDCNYTMLQDREQSLEFQVAPETITFHLFEKGT